MRAGVLGRRRSSVGKRRHGQPDKFQWDGFPIDDHPADEAAAASAIGRFVNTFVIASKRERMLAMLLHADRNKRCEAIQTVYKWIEPAHQCELEGNTGFPQHLRERFGDLRGVFLDEASASHVTIAGAAVLAAGGFGGIFIADAQPIALLFAEVGPPTLCSRPESRRP